MIMTIEIVATFAYKVTEHETFIGSGYLAHETLGVRIEQDGRKPEYNGVLP